MASSSFTISPSRLGCSCGASSVGVPTENLCFSITCRIAGSLARRLSRVVAAGGLGRCERGMTLWKWNCRDDELPWPVNCTYRGRLSIYEGMQVKRPVLTFAWGFDARSLNIHFRLWCSLSTCFSSPSSSAVDPSSRNFKPVFNPASTSVSASSGREVQTTDRVSHPVPLESKLLSQVEEDVLNFLLLKQYSALCASSRVGFTVASCRVDEGGRG